MTTSTQTEALSYQQAFCDEVRTHCVAATDVLVVLAPRRYGTSTLMSTLANANLTRTQTMEIGFVPVTRSCVVAGTPSMDAGYVPRLVSALTAIQDTNIRVVQWCVGDANFTPVDVHAARL